jgi:hypothetical protein
LELPPFDADHCLDFNPKSGPGQEDNTFGITVEANEKLIVDLQWAEPWFGVKTDLDAYLLDSSGKPLTLVEGGTSDNIKQRPVEELAWENPKAEPQEVQLAINRCFSTQKQQEEEKGGCNPFASRTTKPRVKVIFPENGVGISETEYPESSEGDVVGPTVYGHAGSPNVIGVGAVPFNQSNAVEPYSSHGPVTHYFGPVTSTTPAPAVTPQTIQKPDFVASDCVSTTFFVAIESVPGFHFCGTSAAAPHAAAVIALARQANPTASPTQIRAGLAATARAVGPFSDDVVVGAGLLDAYDAIDEIALPPKISIVRPPPETNQRQPAIAFSANRPVRFSCSLDGSPQTSCVSPFVPEKPLQDGAHTLLVSGIDLSGRSGQAEAAFVVDTVPPRTFFEAHPRKNIRIRGRRARVVFRFGSDTPGARFVCRVDGGLFQFCPATLSRRFGPGAHAVRVKAVDPAGNVDPSPAVYRFRVRRVGSRG